MIRKKTRFILKYFSVATALRFRLDSYKNIISTRTEIVIYLSAVREEHIDTTDSTNVTRSDCHKVRKKKYIFTYTANLWEIVPILSLKGVSRYR